MDSCHPLPLTFERMTIIKKKCCFVKTKSYIKINIETSYLYINREIRYSRSNSIIFQLTKKVKNKVDREKYFARP